MTLGKLVITCCHEETNVSPELSNLEVRQLEKDEICFFGLMNYFFSEKFLKDQNELLLEYEDRIYHGLTPYLFFSRDTEGVFTLNLSAEENSENEQ